MMNGESALQEITSFVNEYTAASAKLFPVEIRIVPGNKVQVFLDADDGITIEKCTQLNRALYKFIEESGLFEDGNFSLEVSSPGLDEPLKLLRQYTRNIGRKVEVVTLDGTRTEGTLTEANEHDFMIEEKTGKGKKVQVTTKKFLYNEIKHTKVLITF